MMHQPLPYRLPPSSALLALLFVAPLQISAAQAGVWKGAVTHNGSPAANATVTICNTPATTSNSGRFRIAVPGTPKSCPVSVAYRGRNSSSVATKFRPYLSLQLRNAANGWVVEIK